MSKIPNSDCRHVQSYHSSAASPHHRWYDLVAHHLDNCRRIVHAGLDVPVDAGLLLRRLLAVLHLALTVPFCDLHGSLYVQWFR